jgi:hypothetical protein
MFASSWCLVPLFTLGVAVHSTTSAAAEPAPTAETPESAEEDRRAGAVLAALGEQAGEHRTVSSWSKVIVGGAFTTAGALVDARYDASYGPALWLTGVALIANGLTSLLVRPAIEAFADDMGPSPVGLEAQWRARAADAKSRRNTIAVLDLGVGVAGAAAATILTAGVGDLSREDRARWVALTGLAGGVGIASGLHNLLVQSDIEKGYAVAYPEAAAAGSTVDVGVAPLPNGAAVQLHATF